MKTQITKEDLKNNTILIAAKDIIRKYGSFHELENQKDELLKAVIMSKDIFTKLMASGRLTMPAEDYEMIKKAINKATK